MIAGLELVRQSQSLLPSTAFSEQFTLGIKSYPHGQHPNVMMTQYLPSEVLSGLVLRNTNKAKSCPPSTKLIAVDNI